MRLVVDTNVFVSAALKKSSWPAVVVRWLLRSGGLAKTAATEQEVFEVLTRPRIAEDVLPLLPTAFARSLMARKRCRSPSG